MCQSACAQTRQLERAFTYFERMEAVGVKGNMYTYSALLAACENCEQPARAQEVFEQMQAQGIKPNANTIVHRHKTQRPRQYKKYVLRQHAARPLAAVRAPDLGSGDSAGPDSRTGGSFLPPPGAEVRGAARWRERVLSPSSSSSSVRHTPASAWYSSSYSLSFTSLARRSEVECNNSLIASDGVTDNLTAAALTPRGSIGHSGA